MTWARVIAIGVVSVPVCEAVVQGLMVLGMTRREGCAALFAGGLVALVLAQEWRA